MRNQVFKKLFSVLLALIMVAGLLPASVLAEGEGNAETTPAPTEAVQPTESAEPTAPTETETPEVTEVPEPTPENPATTVVPTQGEPTADPTDEGIMPANVMPVQAATEISYVTKDGNGKRLEDDIFYRIFLLDCGRKYFTVDEIKGIIDLLAKNHYTHIELAFGNEGLRLLLNEDDMGLSFYDKDGNLITKTGKEVNAAIQYGNDQFDSAASYNPGNTEELTQDDMDTIITYAKENGIGVIPLFNAPGHMYTVIKAMEKLGLGTNGKKAGNAGSSPNWAIDPTNATAVNFTRALLQKYVDYFKNACTLFNIGADESNIDTSNYSAYAMLVNSHAAMVQNAGMVAMAFNDGIYNPAYTSSLNGVVFDSNIVISYWTYSKLATAEELAKKGFIINSTHNNWYYVLGQNDSNWAGLNTALKNMETVKCTDVDSGYTTGSGCTLAVWCDNAYQPYSSNQNNVKSLIEKFSQQNPTYFKAEEVKVPAVTVSDENKTVKEATKNADNTYKVVLHKATEGAAASQTLLLTVTNGTEGAKYTWTSNNTGVATVENGLVTFKGAAGTVTITATPVPATPVPATRSNTETAAYSITLNVEVEGDVKLKEKPITVTVGSIATETITGKNYAGNYTTENPEIATVTVTGTDAKAGDVTYNNANNVRYRDLAGSNTSWTETIYYYKVGDNYYPVYAYYQTTWEWNGQTTTYYYGYSANAGSNVTLINSSTRGNNTVNGLYTKSGTDPVDASTTVIFEGKAVGETTVVVGNVKYNIKVTKEDVTNVAALPVQLWITNNAIEAANSTSENYWAASWSQGTNNGNAFYVNISAGVAYGAEGASIVDLMPNKIMRYEFGGTYFEKARDGKAAKELVVWSGRVHGSSNAQKIYGKDYSNVGTEFKYIRYLGGKWEVSNNRVDWTKVEGTNTLSTEQVVVYYMIRSEITEEITTDVADWGYWNTDTNYSDRINANSYVILDFAVKIDGAERKPASFPQNGKTFVFHCDSGAEAVVGTNTYTRYRQLNNFRAIDNLDENYEVYKVTVTMTKDGSDSSSIIQDTTNYAYEGKEQIIWAIDEDVRNASGLDDYVSITGANSDYNGCKIGGDPYIRGVEVYNQHGALITYYIRAKAVLSNLRVHYRIEGSDKDFYSYGIIAAENTVFGENFGEDRNTETWLKDNVVTDKDGHIITVTAKLEKVDGMGAQYKYGNYTFKRTAREDKDVYLYYTFDANVTFVVDFGLPLKIMPKDVAPNLAIANIQSVTASSQMSRYADVTIGDNYSIIYTLKSMISDADLVSVTYEGTNLTTGLHDSAAFNIHIIPATNVYYEDSFAKFTDGSYNGVTIAWEDAGTKPQETPTQALETLGQEKHNPYGYDPAYDKCTMFSMGSAKKVTVTSDMAKTGVVWPTAQFTFKGTGFDIISLTDNTSGAIFVDVYAGKEAKGTMVKSYIVDNYYGYKQDESGNWVVDKNAKDNAIYQIPVMQVRELTYGEYTAVVTVFYDKAFNHTAKSEYSFWLDAVRVYNPMGVDNDIYNTRNEKEGYPQYIKLRNELAKEDGSVTVDSAKLLFIDGAENAAISLYKNYGPNNEVYLAKGQAITFKLAGDLNNIATVQIGAKAPNGQVELAVGGIKVVENLNTATEMYYAITEQAIEGTGESASAKSVTITNSTQNILSLTNLKITFNSKPNTEVTLAKPNEAEQQDAVATVRALFAPAPVEPEPEPEPEKTFEPERFEASWSRNVMQGRKATLTVKTSEDVEAITVDGQTIRSYRTRTERVGFGRRAKRITYREFTYSMVAQETADFSVTAINAEGTESEAITARLTVKTRPNSMRDMWDWFKGWF